MSSEPPAPAQSTPSATAASIATASAWRPLARGAAEGIALGAMTALVLWSLDAAAVCAAAEQVFDDRGEQLRFLRYTLGQLLGAGVAVGLILGAIVSALDRLAAIASPAHPRSATESDDPILARATAALRVLLVAPAVLVCVLRLFDGRRARLLPAHHLLVAAVAALALAGLYALAHATPRLLRRARSASPRSALAAVAAASAIAGLLYAADVRVLPRLYPPFHLALETGIVSSSLFIATLLGHRARRLLPARLPRGSAPSLLLLGLLCAAWSMRQMAFWPSLRAIAFEHSVFPARLLEAASALRLSPKNLRAPPRPAPLDDAQDPVAAAAVTPTQGSPVEPLPAGPRLADTDVFLITVDAMRADRLDALLSPRLHAVAEQGVVFDRAYSQVPHTSFSIATLLTGKYVYSLTALGGEADSHETLADVFKRERYKTAAFFPPSVFFIDHDRFTEVERTAYHFEYVKYEYMAAPGRTDQVIDFLEWEHPERVFVWVHYFDPHEPYELHPAATGATGDAGPPPSSAAPEELTAASTDRDRYDGEVRFVDQAVARLIDYIRTHRRNALVVFTADHGEEFGEHGGRYHGTTLYEEQLRVPLFLAHFGAGGPLPARHIGAPVALIDLAPTLLSLADLIPSAKMRGQDLGPWLSTTGAATARLPPVYAEIGAKKLIAEGDERLICDLSLDFCELYELASDPLERRNLTNREPERSARLKSQLDGWLVGQSTFERAEAGGGADAGATTSTVAAPAIGASARAALERGRLGDRSAAREVAALLESAEPSLREQAARVLIALPDEPAVHAAIAAAHTKHPGDATLAALSLRGGDAALADTLSVEAAAPSADPRLRAEVALALLRLHHPQAVPLLAAALRGGGVDEDLEKRVIAALGASRAPAALAPLVEHLENVRTRLDAARALGALHDPRAVAPLAAAVEDEPYVTARAAMAQALGDLGDARAAPALSRLLAKEHEAVVTGEVVVALARLGATATARGVDLRRVPRWSCDAGGCVPPEKGAPLPLRLRADQTAWLVFTDGALGAVEAAGERLELTPERRAYPVQARGPIVLRTLSGSPRLRAAFAAPAR